MRYISNYFPNTIMKLVSLMYINAYRCKAPLKIYYQFPHKLTQTAVYISRKQLISTLHIWDFCYLHMTSKFVRTSTGSCVCVLGTSFDTACLWRSAKTYISNPYYGREDPFSLWRHAKRTYSFTRDHGVQSFVGNWRFLPEIWKAKRIGKNRHCTETRSH
jgi:hypothetical protein